MFYIFACIRRNEWLIICYLTIINEVASGYNLDKVY